MSAIRRIFPAPALSAGVAGLWLVVVSSFTLNSVLMALVLGILLPLATQGFWPDRPRLVRPGLAITHFLKICGDIVVANWEVARLVLGPVSRLHPAFFTVPLDVEHPFLATLLGATVSLTPGTVSVEIVRDGTGRTTHLFVHGLNVEDEAKAIATIKARYEAPLLEMFQC
ncbi:MAG: Na+/H+ antiporter subunit E [Thermaurantiacus sp.]